MYGFNLKQYGDSLEILAVKSFHGAPQGRISDDKSLDIKSTEGSSTAEPNHAILPSSRQMMDKLSSKTRLLGDEVFLVQILPTHFMVSCFDKNISLDYSNPTKQRLRLDHSSCDRI